MCYICIYVKIKKVSRVNVLAPLQCQTKYRGWCKFASAPGIGLITCENLMSWWRNWSWKCQVSDAPFAIGRNVSFEPVESFNPFSEYQWTIHHLLINHLKYPAIKRYVEDDGKLNFEGFHNEFHSINKSLVI